MPDKEYVLNKIVLDSSLTKVEKLKKMYIFMRKEYPKDRKEQIYDFCKFHYDNVNQGKKKNDSFYYG